MTTIQWFMHNQEYFYLSCQNEKLAFKQLDLLILSLDKILKQAPIYLRTSGNICLYILSICNTFLRVFYSLFIKKKTVQFKKEYIINLEKYIDEIQSILESDLLEVWKTGLEFELLMIKIVIDKLPNEYEQGQEILNSVAFEILIFSEGLIAAIINGGKFLFNKIQNKFAKPIEKYNIYYFFESLKWNVIAQLKRHYAVLTIEKQLMDGYNNYIQSSNDWLIHYCWIKMISDLLIYGPLLQRDIIFSNLTLLEKNSIQQLKDFLISIYQTNQLISNSNKDQKQQLEVLIQSNLQILKSINLICSQTEQLIQNKKLYKLALIDSEYLDQVDKIEYKFLFNCLNSLITYTQKTTFLDSIQDEYDGTYISIISLFQKCQQSSFSKPLDEEESDFKVRECLCFYLITMQNFIQEGVVTQFCQQMIKQMWIQEKIKRSSKLYKTKNQQSYKKVIFFRFKPIYQLSERRNENQIRFIKLFLFPVQVVLKQNDQYFKKLIILETLTSEKNNLLTGMKQIQQCRFKESKLKKQFFEEMKSGLGDCDDIFEDQSEKGKKINLKEQILSPQLQKSKKCHNFEKNKFLCKVCFEQLSYNSNVKRLILNHSQPFLILAFRYIFFSITYFIFNLQLTISLFQNVVIFLSEQNKNSNIKPLEFNIPEIK